MIAASEPAVKVLYRCSVEEKDRSRGCRREWWAVVRDGLGRSFPAGTVVTDICNSCWKALTKNKPKTRCSTQTKEKKKRMKNSIAVLAVLVCLAACGGGGGVSAPSTPTPTPVPLPQVAGNYAGSGTIAYPELGESASCSARTTVIQSGSTVNLGNIVGGGQCSGSGFPAREVTIDTNGTIIGGTTGTFFDADCGGTYSYTLSGSFAGRDLRLSVSATSTTCWNYNFNAVLTR